jgi:NADH-quinone oxidoreductase subunit G
MEGLNRTQPGALLPWVWSPGWNSNQSLHKFQTHAGGPLKGGTAGVRLLQPGEATAPGSRDTNPTAAPDAGSSAGLWQLVPRPRIFGSDELSALSPGLAELVVPAFIELCPADADGLGVAAGDGVEVGDGLATLEVRVNATMTPGCAGYSIGFAGTANLAPLARVALRRAADWQRPPQLIGSDRGTGAGGRHV